MGHRRAVGFFCLMLLACGREGAREPEPPRAPSEAAAPLGTRPFVVFARTELLIDRLEVPVAAPVTVGSSPSPATLTSDAPDVVSINAGGAFVGHRDGTATIRSAAGGSLRVRVDAAEFQSLVLAPRRLSLAEGAVGGLRLLDGATKREIAAERAVWQTSDPRVATMVGTHILAGRHPGRARITARLGERTAEAIVVVGRTDRKGGGSQ